jgi:hypothetical protein
MQTPVSGGKGFLPALPAALRVESGIVGKYGLSFNDDRRAAFCDDFVLAVFLFRIFYEIEEFKQDGQDKQDI